MDLITSALTKKNWLLVTPLELKNLQNWSPSILAIDLINSFFLKCESCLVSSGRNKTSENVTVSFGNQHFSPIYWHFIDSWSNHREINGQWKLSLVSTLIEMMLLLKTAECLRSEASVSKFDLSIKQHVICNYRLRLLKISKLKISHECMWLWNVSTTAVVLLAATMAGGPDQQNRVHRTDHRYISIHPYV